MQQNIYVNVRITTVKKDKKEKKEKRKNAKPYVRENRRN